MPPPEFPPPLPGRLYIHLFHGRKDPKQDMDDWGFAGPWIGPLEYVQWTYGTLRFEFEDSDQGRAAEALFGSHLTIQAGWTLPLHEDMVKFAGSYYGDFTILRG